MRGFVPARRGTFVSAKVPKTIFARARPQGGPSASAPNQDGCATRSEVQSHLSAQTVLAEGVDSVLRLRRAQRVEDKRPVRQILRRVIRDCGEDRVMPKKFNSSPREVLHFLRKGISMRFYILEIQRREKAKM